MLLGVYWYYGFPKGLYHFDFFAFRPGLGGHADGPAELTATVRASDPAALLAGVRAVATRYPEVHLFGEVHGPLLRLTVGYGLSDYAFHVAGELERVLRQQQATLAAVALPAGAQFIRLTAPEEDKSLPIRYGGILQAVSSRNGKHQAETMSLRLDCHLPLAHKAAFSDDLNKLCQEAELDVLYYLKREIGQQGNLMLFFSNGRQGVGGQPLRYTNVSALAPLVAQRLAAHGGQPGYLGQYPAHYPDRGPHIVRMVDEDFVLGARRGSSS